MYNKLRSFEIDVKGGSSYDSRGTAAPTHSAFISAASTNSKMSYPDQSHSTTFTSTSSSHTASSNVMENVHHKFEKKAGRKMKFNNKDAARFDKKKVGLPKLTPYYIPININIQQGSESAKSINPEVV
ncbi:hypothetical protein Tco_1294536 [Tanacetum coccineum]